MEQENTMSASSPLIEQKRHAIKSILEAKDLYKANDWTALFEYIKETNDPGELSDIKNKTGLSIDELLTQAKAHDKKSHSPVTVLGSKFYKDIAIYDFLTEDFFFNNFYEQGASVLDDALDVIWRIYDDEKTGSKNYIIGIEGIITPTRHVPALGTFGALLTKDGVWRALPVAAFRFE